jgi:hypothetical protein
MREGSRKEQKVFAFFNEQLQARKACPYEMEMYLVGKIRERRKN